MDRTLPAHPSQAALDVAAGYAQQALSPATLRAYRSDWADFTAWCRAAALEPLPAAPQTIAAYLAAMVRVRTRATIQRRLVSIGQAHKLAGQDWRPSHPAIRNTMRGMFRQHGKPPRKAAALGREEVVMLLEGSVEGLAAVRDRAIFLLGFSGALRRAELAAVRREDLTFRADGLRLLIPRSKGDQEGEGAEIGIPRGANPATCPVRAVQRWLEASDCDSGPVFRKIRAEGTIMDEALHPSSIRYILRKRAAEAGLEVGRSERLSPHGLRAGFITEAYKAGARDEEIMGHTRHKDADTMRGYVRRAKLLSESPAKKLGL